MPLSVLAAIVLISCASLRGQTPNTKMTPAVGPSLKVTILGSGAGPLVDPQRFGASILVETAGGDKLVFDCGRGFAQRLTEYGVSLGAVDKLFLTHLHSDHILSIPDLLPRGLAARTKDATAGMGAGGHQKHDGLHGQDVRVRHSGPSRF